MQGGQPITDAVYGKRSTVRKTARKPARRPAVTILRTQLGEESVAEIYRALGFKRPDQRSRGRG